MQPSLARESQPLARPFIKWAGGKGQLIPELARRLPPRFRRYHEPFVGGGALFFHLFNHGLLRDGAVLSDYNPELMVCYEVIRDDVESLITALRWHHRHRLDPHYFLEVRNWDRQPDFAQRSKIERAARTIFLNRTCYNGLYRLNRKGQFNAPFGYYKNPLICDPENLRLVSAALRNVELCVGDFSDVLHRAEPGDLVYFDPPYVPMSATASFTHYTGQTFGPDDQRRLADVFAELGERGVYVMLSNSSTPLTRELYAARAVSSSVVYASRKINCDGSKRGHVEELIVCSYPTADYSSSQIP
ncbi:MAG: DNA adenine methylase [Roseiflexus sp.]|nr:DNA adenine methylase [Roseiflexus sp.]